MPCAIVDGLWIGLGGEMPVKETIGRIERILELHIRLEKIVRSLDTSLSTTGLPIAYADFRALGCVLTLGPTTLKHAADTLGLPKTTIHYIMQKLEAAGYIERTTVRKKSTPVFSVTPAGREAWGQAVQALLEGPFGKALTRTTDEQLAGLMDAIRRIWTDAGAALQNETIFLEATVLAVSAAELLLSSEAGKGKPLDLDRTSAPPESQRSTF